MIGRSSSWAPLAILLAASLAGGANGAAATDCVVTTPNGRIIGHRSSIQPEVCEFLGIPYAAAPVGELRFAAPEAQNLTGDFTADSWVS